jgi:uncharacterized phage protein (TIGR01671 family)
MRQILFRGLRTDGKGWAEGDLHNNPLRYGSQTQIYIADGDEEKKDAGWVDVDRKSIGQFTGLLDDNGVKIFDGDLVEVSINGVHLVEWNDDLCLFQFSDGTPINSGHSYGVSKSVTGNIHEGGKP